MKQMLRRLTMTTLRRFLPAGVRNSLRLWTMLDLRDRPIEMIEDFSTGPVVVLAPHMDDEIIGPGGSLILHAQAGAKVWVIMLTDGSQGDADLRVGDPGAQELERRQQAVTESRKEESRQAARIAGIGDPEFYDLPDGALDDAPAIVARVAAALEQRWPAVIYLPALTDNHHDHWGSNRILRSALDRLPADLLAKMIIRGYEIWPPLPANRIADITGVMKIKEQAIAAFPSQLKLRDFVNTSLGLNRYRSMWAAQGRGYAEAFLETTVAEYRELYAAISLDGRREVGTNQSSRSEKI